MKAKSVHPSVQSAAGLLASSMAHRNCGPLSDDLSVMIQKEKKMEDSSHSDKKFGSSVLN